MFNFSFRTSDREYSKGGCYEFLTINFSYGDYPAIRIHYSNYFTKKRTTFTHVLRDSQELSAMIDSLTTIKNNMIENSKITNK